MKPETLTKVRTLVLRATEEELEAVLESARMRRKQLQHQATLAALSTLCVGDTVRLKGIRPQYLNGAKGTIKEVRQTKFTIELYGSYTKSTGRIMKTIIVPAVCLEPA